MYLIRTLVVLACAHCIAANTRSEEFQFSPTDPSTIYYTEPYNNKVTTDFGLSAITELPGGRITKGERLLERSRSPYVIRDDLFVERDGTLVIESGVQIQFAPMIGITIRGIIMAEVRPNAPERSLFFLPRTSSPRSTIA